MIVHFNEPSLSFYFATENKSLYSFNPAWTLCRKFNKDFKKSEIASRDATQISCPKCIAKMTCKHEWKYLYTGRHGSDKGDRYYECLKCKWHLREATMWTPDKDHAFFTSIFDSLSKYDKHNLAVNLFKPYIWRVKCGKNT